MLKGEWIAHWYPYFFYITIDDDYFSLAIYTKDVETKDEIESLGPFPYNMKENEIIVNVNSEEVAINYIFQGSQLWVINGNRVEYIFYKQHDVESKIQQAEDILSKRFKEDKGDKKYPLTFISETGKTFEDCVNKLFYKYGDLGFQIITRQDVVCKFGILPLYRKRVELRGITRQ